VRTGENRTLRQATLPGKTAGLEQTVAPLTIRRAGDRVPSGAEWCLNFLSAQQVLEGSACAGEFHSNRVAVEEHTDFHHLIWISWTKLWLNGHEEDGQFSNVHWN
jgi:hypothetical protein